MNADLTAGFRRLGAAVAQSFRVLHRIEWSAPWSDRPTQSRRA
jgi:hypothetical protein